MKIEVAEVSPTRKEIKIEIEAADVRAEFERVTQEYARAVSVPGFRKGHAPVGVVRTRYKKDIQTDVLKRLVPEAVERAVEESGLQVIGQPDVHLDNENLDKLGQESVTLHAHVEVMPDVALGEYKGIEAARRTRPVPVDFQGRCVEPEEEEDINVSDVDIVVGGPGVLTEFNENMTGVQPDEVKTFTVKYPEDFGPGGRQDDEKRRGLAGKTIEYTATVTSVRRKEVPALDDDWVKSLGEEEVETVEPLRARVRENLTKSAEHESEHRLRDEVLGQLIERHRFEVPETIVSYQANQILQSMIRDMISRGADPRTQDINWEAMRDLVRERAGDDVRGSMLLERVADAENIEVTQEEIDAEIESIAEGSRQSVEQVRASLTKQGGERSIADRLRNRKALDFLVQHAQVRDEEWREEDAESQPEEAPADSQEEGAEGGGQAASAEGS